MLDRLIFSSIKRRGGKRGQKGESISTAISRRIRQAWDGEWQKLWEDSASLAPSAQGAKQTPTQILARDIKAIQEAMGDDDIRAALRVVDGRVSMASEAKALACLPDLFPTAPLPTPHFDDPDPDDVARFEEELIKAYKYAPRKRGAGPGGARGEHWEWMPQHPLAWEQCSALLLRIALGKVSPTALGAIHSGRALALDRPEANRVRPLAVGNLHRRLVSKAITKTFTLRIQEVLGTSEYSLGANGAAEGMHKAVLIDLDQRPDAIKASFDISNAHN